MEKEIEIEDKFFEKNTILTIRTNETKETIEEETKINISKRNDSDCLVQRIYKLDEINYLKSINYKDLSDDLKTIHEYSIGHVIKELSRNRELLSTEEVQQQINNSESKNNNNPIDETNNKNIMSCYFVLLDRNNIALSYIPVSSYNTNSEDYVIKNNEFNYLKSTYNCIKKRRQENMIDEKKISTNKQNESILNNETHCLEKVNSRSIVQSNKNKNPDVTQLNFQTFGLIENDSASVKLKKLKEYYLTKKNEKSSSYIKHEWFLAYHHYFENLLMQELNLFCDLLRYANKKNKKVEIDFEFYEFKQILSLMQNIPNDKKKILCDFLLNLISLISTYLGTIEKSSYDLCHTESYVTVSLFKLLAIDKDADIIDWDIIKSNYKNFIEKLFCNAKINLDEIESNKDNGMKVVILYESLKECCSICKPSIYIINKIFKSMFKNISLYSFFRYETPLTQNDSKTHKSNNPPYSMANLNKLLTDLSNNHKIKPIEFEKEVVSLQFERYKTPICLSKKDFFISGGEYFVFENS
jgi:hypothetical protein